MPQALKRTHEVIDVDADDEQTRVAPPPRTAVTRRRVLLQGSIEASFANVSERASQKNATSKKRFNLTTSTLGDYDPDAFKAKKKQPAKKTAGSKWFGSASTTTTIKSGGLRQVQANLSLLATGASSSSSGSGSGSASASAFTSIASGSASTSSGSATVSASSPSTPSGLRGPFSSNASSTPDADVAEFDDADTDSDVVEFDDADADSDVVEVNDDSDSDVIEVDDADSDDDDVIEVDDADSDDADADANSPWTYANPDDFKRLVNIKALQCDAIEPVLTEFGTGADLKLLAFLKKFDHEALAHLIVSRSPDAKARMDDKLHTGVLPTVDDFCALPSASAIKRHGVGGTYAHGTHLEDSRFKLRNPRAPPQKFAERYTDGPDSLSPPGVLHLSAQPYSVEALERQRHVLFGQYFGMAGAGLGVDCPYSGRPSAFGFWNREKKYDSHVRTGTSTKRVIAHPAGLAAAPSLYKACFVLRPEDIDEFDKENPIREDGADIPLVNGEHITSVDDMRQLLLLDETINILSYNTLPDNFRAEEPRLDALLSGPLFPRVRPAVHGLNNKSNLQGMDTTIRKENLRKRLAKDPTLAGLRVNNHTPEVMAKRSEKSFIRDVNKLLGDEYQATANKRQFVGIWGQSIPGARLKLEHGVTYLARLIPAPEDGTGLRPNNSFKPAKTSGAGWAFIFKRVDDPSARWSRAIVLERAEQPADPKAPPKRTWSESVIDRVEYFRAMSNPADLSDKVAEALQRLPQLVPLPRDNAAVPPRGRGSKPDKVRRKVASASA